MEEKNMSKFCTSCGAQLDDNATFCTSCGAQLGNGAPSAAPQPTAASNAGAAFQNAASQAGDAVKDGFNKAKESLSMENIKNLKSNPNKTTLVVLGGIVIVAIIVIIVLFNLIFAHPYKGTLDDYFKAIAKNDPDLYKDTMPEYQIEYLEDNRGDDFDIDEYVENILDSISDELEDKYGDDIKITYDIKEEKKLTDKKLDDIKDDIKDTYDAKVKVTKGYKVKMKLKIKGDDDDRTDTVTFTMAKVDGKWVVVNGGLDI